MKTPLHFPQHKIINLNALKLFKSFAYLGGAEYVEMMLSDTRNTSRYTQFSLDESISVEKRDEENVNMISI